METTKTKSFREAVSASWSKGIDVSFTSIPHIGLSTYKGEPALFISEEEEARLALPYQYTLVGKFQRGRPPMASLRKEITAAAFNGEVHLGLMDQQHILFKFQLECDFHRMWMKKAWTFQSFEAKIFRWTPDFSTDREPSITPVWIKLPQLPIHLYNKEKLYSIGSAVGTPLKVDLASAAAEKVLRPSEARICVELDVLKPHPNRVWIGSRERGRWQQIEIEDLPAYCTDCKKLGHSLTTCENRMLTNGPKPSSNAPKIWIPVGKPGVQNQASEEDKQRHKGNAVKIDPLLPMDLPNRDTVNEGGAEDDQHQPPARPGQMQDTPTESKDEEMEGDTLKVVSNEEEPEIDQGTEFLNKLEKRQCALSYTLPRTESAPLLRIHWLDKESPEPEIPDIDAQSKSLYLDEGQGDNTMVKVQFQEQVMSQIIQAKTPVKTSRYNLRSLSKAEIFEIQNSKKKKRKRQEGMLWSLITPTLIPILMLILFSICLF